MSSNLYIPKTLKVGFNKRPDTYTGKLAYVTYFDEKNVLRKEGSWEGWRDKKIPAVEYANVPTRFVINKGVERYGSYGSGRSVLRIYDSRDFEFEISVDNLIYILMHSDVSKRDIDEECVFAWDRQELVLLPVNSEEYKQAIEYTAKQGTKFSLKNLVLGHSYALKKLKDDAVYIGYYDYAAKNWDKTYRYLGKKHVFYHNKEFVTYEGNQLSHAVSDETSPDFSSLVDKFIKSKHYIEMNKLKITVSPVSANYLNHSYNLDTICYFLVDNTYHAFNFKTEGYEKLLISNVVSKTFTVDADNNTIQFNKTKYSEAVDFSKLIHEKATTNGCSLYKSHSYYNRLNIDVLALLLSQLGFKNVKFSLDNTRIEI